MAVERALAELLADDEKYRRELDESVQKRLEEAEQRRISRREEFRQVRKVSRY